ncbi:MAG TPA: hypothetical protein PK760_11490 [Flavobacteriales bacterium]|nr:hypothetical protein [Flavobacteriales bacterium]
MRNIDGVAPESGPDVHCKVDVGVHFIPAGSSLIIANKINLRSGLSAAFERRTLRRERHTTGTAVLLSI